MSAVDDFLRLLDLTPSGEGRWTGATAGPDSLRPNLYGGLIAAQALRAAHLSAGLDRAPHSMHAYFLRSGQPGVPLRLDVDTTRDGRSFSARRVEVSQEGGTILTMIASFQVPEDGNDYQIDRATLAEPDEGSVDLGSGHQTGLGNEGPFQMVKAAGGERQEGSLDWSTTRYWTRTRSPLPDDPGLHACALVAMGDLNTGEPLSTARASDLPYQMTSLDYSVWFHRSLRADDWLLFDLRPSGNGGGRGLALGLVHDALQRQVATYGMELMLRDRPQGWSGGWHPPPGQA